MNNYAHRDGKGIEQHYAIDNIVEADMGLIANEINQLLKDMIGDLLAIQSILAPIAVNKLREG